MADETKEFLKRRKELAGFSALTTSVNKNSPLSKLGPSGKVSSVLKDMPKDKGTTAGKVLKKIFSKSPVGRIVDTAVKVGAGVGAGYEYAKSKFKDKEEKVDKKATGGMADYIKDLL